MGINFITLLAEIILEYSDVWISLSVHSTSGKNGVPVMTKPHPTNPDYEYVYYYDYEEEEEGEGEGMEKEGGIPDKAVRTTQSSPPATRTSPSSRVSAFPGRKTSGHFHIWREF